MISFIFLLVMALVPQMANAAANNCGNNREVFVPKGISSPGDFAKIFGISFQALQEVNRGLTERNFRAEETLCVPIKSDDYLVQIEKDKAAWEKKIAGLRGELKASKKKIGDLNAALGAAYIGWRIVAGTLVVLVVSLAVVSRRLYRHTHRDARRRTLLRPSYFERVTQRMTRSRTARRR
ncbi:hypothetical protein A3H65_03615 [Candidatus Giovannonibacteria bacterium RIFCSPLOWO2_02_FULL_45_14]|uniref:LysM domain-containing protein n=1 Tax=Candidatus Giovannonibacteria bacterium RIFCSPLOWO2_12_FULL_44_15 TaxID=1798364 RepID=A0A1F5Y0Q9_9BACT|nr:MAG: hypothetical protein A3C75_03625 [Candidatus Giovannonibacteria bacterium RIFCSPHIGHO2_02_FULL_44_31]OGF76002.1 MAG: hypothetical protein A3E62_01725 [Candidatus Giovannonibacteria bacterium RIFCSPHIGHO2_12_FULL_44_29]OGF90755.1 MAG: hypothetical protein A3H65_03615 [Candidatus Giovannonibacteria bacterium RIFCSPLOWO2_02_FULL_45_14]OGF93656.1 MAG: hypothetical protein A3G54_03910 [Candidatus Giovannonibacteria bacterium RIFCSPLOWO2_12_FULL_44_15]